MLKTIQYAHGATLSYAVFGSPGGFPILIQHGLIASIRSAHLFERLIETGARLICSARPGYGESSPYPMKDVGEWGEITAVLADELNLPSFDVLGISSGAPYSYAVAHQLPERVRNVFILSGTPALYDENVQSHWPYPLDRAASLAAMQSLARELFFANLSPADLASDDIRDAMRNDAFGVGLDLKIRCRAWGFDLSEVKARVVMRHSRADESVPLITAQRTANLLSDCALEIRETDAHFCQEVLDDFICTRIAPYYRA